MTYTIISDRWSKDLVHGVTYGELESQAKDFNDPLNDRICTIERTVRHLEDVVIDNTGEIIAVSDSDWSENPDRVR